MLLAGNYLFGSMSRMLSDCLFSHGGCSHIHERLIQTHTRIAQLFVSEFGGVVFNDIERELHGLKSSYGGQAIKIPHKVTAEQIEHGLPPEGAGGKIDVLQVATGAVRKWLEDPNLALKPQSEWPSEPPRAKVFCDKAELNKVMCLLWRRGVVEAIDDNHVFTALGKQMLQGMFGVERPQDPVTPSGPGLRVIINLIPTNTYLREQAGDVCTLPMGGQWAVLVLLEGEVVWLRSEDQKACFYLYQLPKAWWASLCLIVGQMVGRLVALS